MTLNGRYTLRCIYVYFTEYTTHIWKKIDPHYGGKIHPHSSSFWQYKTPVDIRRGSLESGLQMTMGWSKMAIFSVFVWSLYVRNLQGQGKKNIISSFTNSEIDNVEWPWMAI